jgi:hypothetical protein
MKNLLLMIAWVFIFASPSLSAQTETKNFRNFPLVVTLQFHSLATPFSNLKAHFKNIGIGLGTEISHNGWHNWVQQFNVIWYRNRAVGNGLLFSTQVAWRPYLINAGYGEIKAGIGYVFANRPTQSFVQKNGVWQSVGKKGKGMLAIPIGVGLGYHAYQAETFVSPFIAYQLVIMKGYNKSAPIFPATFVQAGSRIHFRKTSKNL